MKSAVDSNEQQHHTSSLRISKSQRVAGKPKTKQLHFICRDEGISLICLEIAEHIDRSKILSVQRLISKSCLALSLIRAPLVSLEVGVMPPPGVGGMFGILSACFSTPKGTRVFRQVKTAYLIDGRQIT